jgi:hypothetical protein
MEAHELKLLFNKYLKRDFTEIEWADHGKKSNYDFEKEISNCIEYLNLKKNSHTDLKIAIILTGHIRKNSILGGIDRFCNSKNYDIFIHTWDNVGIKGTETSLDTAVDFDMVLEEIQKYKNLKKYEIENNKKWIESQEVRENYFNYSSPEPFIKSQVYSINKGYQLMEEYSIENNINYDIVFIFRFDCVLTDFHLFDKTVFDIKDNNIIFTPNLDCYHAHMDYGTSCWACDTMYYKHNMKRVHVFEHTNVICDIFAYGDMEAMKKYCDLYNKYDELNDSFFEENLKQYQKLNENVKYENGNYILDKGSRGHLDSLYYYNCSYPERLLQKFLKDYMLVKSEDVRVKLIR